MKKIYILIICVFIAPLQTLALSLPSTYSDNVLIYDRTDEQVLLSKNEDKRTNIASLTKIMTTITAIEKIDNLEGKVTITPAMLGGLPWDASIAGLKLNETVTYRDLLYASMLPSGADATQALAISLSGSIQSFVKEMNNLAKSIGMDNSNFVNVTGLDINNHYSTLNDLLKLLNYSLDNKLFKEIYTTREYKLTNGLKVESTVNKYNKLMNLDTSRILGSKTGYTGKAGLCISVLAKSNDHDIVLITTHAPFIYGNYYNLKDALKLIDFIDKNYNNEILFAKDTVLKEIPIRLSKEEKYLIKVNDDIKKYLPVDYDHKLIKFEYTGEEELSYKNKEHSKIGNIKYYYQDELLGSEDVILNKKIEPSIKKILFEYRVYIIISSVFLLLIVLKTFLFKKKRVV